MYVPMSSEKPFFIAPLCALLKVETMVCAYAAPDTAPPSSDSATDGCQGTKGAGPSRHRPRIMSALPQRETRTGLDMRSQRGPINGVTIM